MNSVSLFDVVPASIIVALDDKQVSWLVKAVAMYESSNTVCDTNGEYPVAEAFYKEYLVVASKTNEKKSVLSRKRAEAGRRGGVAKASKTVAKASKSSKCQVCQDLPEQELNTNELHDFATQKNDAESDFATSCAHVIKNQDNINSLNNITIPKEQKKEKESDDSSQKENPESTLIPFEPEEQKKPARIDVSMVKNIWNDTVVSLPPVRSIKDQRLVHLQARIREEGWTTEELSVKLKELFQKVQDSEFLSGRNGKWTRCKFDWVVESRPWNNILEGMYDNENNQPSAAPARTMFCQQGNKPRITERILNDGNDRKSDGGEPGARIELRQFEFEEDGRIIPYHPRPHQVIKIKTSSSH